MKIYFTAKPGDFEPTFHADPVSIAKIGKGRLPGVHCVPRRDVDGSVCLLAMNAYCALESFEVFVDRSTVSARANP